MAANNIEKLFCLVNGRLASIGIGTPLSVPVSHRTCHKRLFEIQWAAFLHTGIGTRGTLVLYPITAQADWRQ